MKSGPVTMEKRPTVVVGGCPEGLGSQRGLVKEEDSHRSYRKDLIFRIVKKGKVRIRTEGHWEISSRP